MMRTIGILVVDVVVFMFLIMIGAAVQDAVAWPSFVVSFLFLPAFLYVSYRVSGSCFGADARGVVATTFSVSMAMGIVFDIMQLPVGSPIATFLIVGIVSICHPLCCFRPSDASTQRST